MQKLKTMGLQYCTLLCTLLLIQGSFTVRGCQYWYVQQPPSEFHCSPYGSKLQLYCVATGPSLPEFHIQWYSGRSVENSVQLANGKGYTIQTTVLDSGHDIRTSSSILQTTIIGESESGTCFWCQIEVGGEPLPVVSSMMCIQNESAYSTELPSCREALLPSGSSLCASSLISQRQQVNGEVHSLTTVLPEPTSSRFVASKGSTSIVEPSVMGQLSSRYLHMSTEAAFPTLPSSGVDPSVTASASPTAPVLQNRSEGSGSDSNLGALYAAIAVCVIFIIVIVILVVVIVVLCGRRKKRSASEVAFPLKPTKARHAAVTGPLLRNAFSEPSVIHPVHECGVPNSCLITNRSCSPADSRSSKTEPVRRIRGDSGSDHDYSDIDDVPLSKPRTWSPSDEEADTYDHLQPVEDETESEKAGKASKEHFYHTLEGKSHNKVHRSQKTSPPSLPQDTTDSADYDEVYEPPLTLSLEELFDDPKYAALFNHNNRGRSAEPADNMHNNQRARFGGALSVSQPNISLIHNQNAYSGARGKRYRHFQSGTTSPQRHEIAVAIEIHKY